MIHERFPSGIGICDVRLAPSLLALLASLLQLPVALRMDRGRVAQAFDLAGTTNIMGAPSFAHSAKGGSGNACIHRRDERLLIPSDFISYEAARVMKEHCGECILGNRTI